MAGFLNQIEYHVTAVTFMVREMFLPPKKLLTETGIAKGFRVWIMVVESVATL